jgi:hypothetical protein
VVAIGSTVDGIREPMSITFTPDVGGVNLGYCEITRQEEFVGPDEVYTYRWEVARRQPGKSISRGDIVSGTVTHLYSDGAWTLIRKVMSSFAETPCAAQP